MLNLQYKTFWLQNLWSTIIFVPTLVAIFVLINFYREWNYSSNVILDNTDFNIVIFVTIAMGGFSLLLSFRVTWVKFVRSISRCISHLDDVTFEEKHGLSNPKSGNIEIWTTRTLEKKRRREDATKTQKFSRKDVKLGNEVTQLLKENQVADHSAYHSPKSNDLHYNLPKSFQTHTKPTIVGKSDVFLEDRIGDDGSDVQTCQACRTKVCPEKMVLVRICGGIMFSILVFGLPITPILIYHMAKPDSPFVYYKPNCPKSENHTKIIKVNTIHIFTFLICKI